MALPGLPDRSSVQANPPRSHATPPPSRSTSTVMKKYEVLRFLGEGSNAKVFLARKLDEHNTPVVVKRIHDHVTQSPRFKQFFEAEVKSMKKFDHPYAVQLLDYSLDDPFGAVLVMEYVDGVTLEQLITHERRLDPDRAGRLLGFLLHALEAAHNAGIVHRDLKPANLMVTGYRTASESLKVMDFGFAGFTKKPHIQMAEITGVGQVFAIGTPAYVSPEMIRGDTVDGRGDLYGTAVILFEMLTGRIPFDYTTVEAVINAHLKEHPPKFNQVGAGHLPMRAEMVVHMCLAKFPSERIQTAKEFGEQFGQAIGWPSLWKDTAPPGYAPAPPKKSEVVLCTAVPGQSKPISPMQTQETFSAYMPERLAAAKLRGFAEDYDGVVAESEPGIVRLIINLPLNHKKPSQARSALISWLVASRNPQPPKGQEPIQLSLQMEKINSNQVKMDATYSPMSEYPVRDRLIWQGRVEALSHALKMYLMASG